MTTLTIQSPETADLIAQEAAVFEQRAGKVRPAVEALRDEIDQLEARLRVLRPQLDSQAAELNRAETRGRDLRTIAVAVCEANDWPVPTPAVSPPLKDTQAIPTVDADTEAIPVRRTVNDSQDSGPMRPLYEANLANGDVEHEDALADFLAAHADEAEEAPVNDEDDNDPPADAPAEATKPRTAGKIRQALRDAGTALMVPLWIAAFLLPSLRLRRRHGRHEVPA